MIKLTLDPASVDRTVDYVEQMKQRIFAGMRAGMREAMQALAGDVIARVHSRTGELVEAIERSPRVKETAEVIRGTIAAKVGRKPIGIWLEEGTHVRAVKGNLYGFTAADGNTVFTRGHRAFDVKPHPILNPALDAMRQPIMEIIAARVREATAA